MNEKIVDAYFLGGLPLLGLGLGVVSSTTVSSKLKNIQVENDDRNKYVDDLHIRNLVTSFFGSGLVASLLFTMKNSELAHKRERE